MYNRKTHRQKITIAKEVYKRSLSVVLIAKKHSVSITTVYNIYDQYFGYCFDDTHGVHLGSKDEPYQTEQEALSSPYYGATNRELITPIREDWKLINYEDEGSI